MSGIEYADSQAGCSFKKEDLVRFRGSNVPMIVDQVGSLSDEGRHYVSCHSSQSGWCYSDTDLEAIVDPKDIERARIALLLYL